MRKPTEFNLFVCICTALTVLLISCSTAEFDRCDRTAVLANLTVAADNSGRMPTALALTDAGYDSFFGPEPGAAARAVPKILASGNYFINGTPVPGSLKEYQVEGFPVNTSEVKVDATTVDDYVVKALAAATEAVPIGNTIQLTDSDGDGYCDRIRYSCYAAFIVARIVENADSTRTVERSAIEGITPFEGGLFAAGNSVKIASTDFDSSIAPGDMVLARYCSNRWVLTRAQEVNGVLVDGEDHGSYNMDGTEYPDAMRFSRGNIAISNRCGEFVNAHKYFGLNNSIYEVSLWLVPVQKGCKTTGAPCGFTSNGNGKKFLEIAIQTAKSKLSAVTVSGDGSGLPAGTCWVSEFAYSDLAGAVAEAEAVWNSASDLTCDCYDYQTYLLYLHMHGSADDIGASFAGYDYAGFDNELHTK